MNVNSLPNKKLVKFLNMNEDFTFLHFTGSMLGIGTSIYSTKSIDRVNSLKNRTDSKGYISLIPGSEWLIRFGLQLNKIQKRLIQQYWPGELTIVFNDPDDHFSNVSVNNKVAIRVPNNGLLRRFIQILEEPIISTSVNRSGQLPVSDLKEIKKKYKNWFDFQLIPRDLKYIDSAGSTIIDCTEGDINIIREGEINIEDLKLSILKPLILFVCTGNTCRSPLAEYYARYIASSEGLPFRFGSAGFLDVDIPMAENSQKLLNEKGIDTSDHSSSLINYKLVKSSWLILTMENDHKRKLIELDPFAEKKIFTLSEYCGEKFSTNSLDIDDPYGSDISQYRITFDIIKERIERLLNIIKKEVE